MRMSGVGTYPFPVRTKLELKAPSIPTGKWDAVLLAGFSYIRISHKSDREKFSVNLWVMVSTHHSFLVHDLTRPHPNLSRWPTGPHHELPVEQRPRESCAGDTVGEFKIYLRRKPMLYQILVAWARGSQCRWHKDSCSWLRSPWPSRSDQVRLCVLKFFDPTGFKNLYEVGPLPQPKTKWNANVLGDDYFILKPHKTVPVFSYTPSLAGLKFSTLASVFTREVGSTVSSNLWPIQKT